MEYSLNIYLENLRHTLNVFLNRRINEHFELEDKVETLINLQKDKLYDEQLLKQYWIGKDNTETDFETVLAMEYNHFISSPSITKNAFRNSVDQRMEHFFVNNKLELKSSSYLPVKRSDAYQSSGIPRLLEPGEPDELPDSNKIVQKNNHKNTNK